ncbi:unnamed protein product [Mytilus edulis]|uniref:Uncharacterized protein n=1 Tax=Mytilus edulis TaxID=6550 RepID=A0A8S3RQ48_MYTED|nr:unnamed protein product [Mytilus edulis]
MCTSSIYLEKGNEGAATTDFAIQILRSTNKQQETVTGSLIITKTFKWVSSAEFVLKLILQPKDGYFIMDSSCRQQLIDAITYLQENDKKEEKKQREDKKRKFDEKKSGPPEKMTGQTQVFDSICIYCGDHEVVGDDNHEISRLKNDNAIVRPICASCMNSGLKIITRNAKKK